MVNNGDQAQFAVFCAEDGGLRFYRRDEAPETGSTFDGREATEVYGIPDYINVDWPGDAPDWLGRRGELRSVSFVDRVSPKTTVYWFRNAHLESIDLSGLDTSSTEDMSLMFEGCTAPSIDLSGLDFGKARSADGMFARSGFPEISLPAARAPRLRRAHGMFSSCRAERIDVSGFEAPLAKIKRDFLSGCDDLAELVLPDSAQGVAMYESMPRSLERDRDLTVSFGSVGHGALQAVLIDGGGDGDDRPAR